jgi:hypothetical protein
MNMIILSLQQVPKVNFDIAPGIKENACYIGTPPGAMHTREKLEEFKKTLVQL